MKYRIYYSLAFFVLAICSCWSQGFVTDLRSAGYVIFPTPQQVLLEGGSVEIDKTWQLMSDRTISQVIKTELGERLQKLHGLDLEGGGDGRIELIINEKAVTDIANPARAEQAYRISIGDQKVRIEGNDEAGLFYGVQSFLQLLKPGIGGGRKVPKGTITDWPDLELRFVHWDTKHHRAKMETLKRYIRWAAYFKVNAIAFEMEDKYEYPSHPVIGSPDAFTKEEMHELTRYALDRFIQLVPNVQAPAHMTFVLKHNEFKHLRAEQESNYQACMCDEEAIQLIFDLYQDMIDATPGVKYFFASTDEVYYAGICDKCKDPYSEVNRSQAWVDYLNRVSSWMEERDRRVLAWVEYPLLPEHIDQLPPNLIDGIMNPNKKQSWIVNENNRGIKQLSYSSIQGSEYLFPNYFPTEYRGSEIEGRLVSVRSAVREVESNGANLIGTFAAAWDDAGLHSETFWLGWATVTQYGWTKSGPSLQQNTADFMDVFYGFESSGLAEAYQMLEEGARYYEALWDKEISKERKKGYGNSHGKGVGGVRRDLTLQMPALPQVKDLKVDPIFHQQYEQKINEASVLLKRNDLLVDHLMSNLSKVDRNFYNLEVLLSIAFIERYTMKFMLHLAKVEDYLVQASETEGDSVKSVRLLVEAYNLALKTIDERKEMWLDFSATWEKSRLPKNANVGGRDFLHVQDDVKDHFADRRIGLDYMMAPFERMHVEKWSESLREIITGYADLHGIPIIGLEVKRLED